MHLISNVGEKNRPQPQVTAGQWYHFVGTYDGQTLKMYVNGELVAYEACTGTMKRPAGGCEYMVIAGDAAPGEPGCFADCVIATANLYSDPLSAAQMNLKQQWNVVATTEARAEQDSNSLKSQAMMLNAQFSVWFTLLWFLQQDFSLHHLSNQES